MFYNNPYSYQPMTYQQQIQQLQQAQQIPQPQIQQQPQVQNSGIFFFVNSQKEVDEWVLNAGQTAFFFDRLSIYRITDISSRFDLYILLDSNQRNIVPL